MAKFAILLPGFMDSPQYLHMQVFSRNLQDLGYDTTVVDPCNLWLGGGDVTKYNITNYVAQLADIITRNQDKYDEILLLGHSMGGSVAIITASQFQQIASKLKIIALCPPAKRDNSTLKWNPDEGRIMIKDLPDNPNITREFKLPFSFIEDAKQYNCIDSAKLIHNPMTIVVCNDDQVVDPAETKQIAANGQAETKLICIENIGHDFRYNINETNKVWDTIQQILNS